MAKYELHYTDSEGRGTYTTFSSKEDLKNFSRRICFDKKRDPRLKLYKMVEVEDLKAEIE